MKTIQVRTWRGFEKALKSIRDQYGTYKAAQPDGSIFEFPDPVKMLFRGQESCHWDLLTTLERKSSRTFDVPGYIRLANRTVNELESFTGMSWRVPPYPDLVDEIRTQQDWAKVHLPMYDYLVYLRHHGFPSPLLDWTESPYIAAYFAYINAGKQNPAVYCYIERPTHVKGYSSGRPRISVMGPFVSTHKRHFAQKASYTIATQWDQSTDAHVFCPHDQVFKAGNEMQDLLIKIVLPAKERKKALMSLNDYNINQFTLFQSEDALVKALEMKNFDFNESSFE
jgi:FRG domain